MVFDHCLSLMSGRGCIIGVLRIFLSPPLYFFLRLPSKFKQMSSVRNFHSYFIIRTHAIRTALAYKVRTTRNTHTGKKTTLKSAHVVGARGQDSGISARNYTGLNLPLPSWCIKVQSTAITTLKQRI